MCLVADEDVMVSRKRRRNPLPSSIKLPHKLESHNESTTPRVQLDVFSPRDQREVPIVTDDLPPTNESTTPRVQIVSSQHDDQGMQIVTDNDVPPTAAALDSAWIHKATHLRGARVTVLRAGGNVFCFFLISEYLILFHLEKIVNNSLSLSLSLFCPPPFLPNFRHVFTSTST